MKDLIILAPDKNTKFGIDGLLSRCDALGIKVIAHESFIHPWRDPGVFNNAAEFLRPRINEYNYCLVFIDREGCGQEGRSKEEIQAVIKTSLIRNGWADRCEVIVLDPELEIWCWIPSPYLSNLLGWPSFSSLKKHVQRSGFWNASQNKPNRPKEAFEEALSIKGIPRSSSLYKKLAENIDISICQDSSFIEFVSVLRKWFAIG
jgi:hypothetical protein